MKYVITGGAGHISKSLAEKLLSAGHEVTVIGRNAENLKTLTGKGAKAAIGSVEDEAFLTETFQGADAVYLMIPPNASVQGSFRDYQNGVSDAYVAAIKNVGVKRVVMLSSIGAHLGKGTGPVDGLYDMEQKLKTLSNVHVKFLRPSYFMYNLYGMMPMVKNMNIMGSNFGGADEKLVLVHTTDIAEAAAEELQNANLSGHSVRYVASDERATADVARVLGTAVGKPELPWIPFNDADTLSGMTGAGLPEAMASEYVEMGATIRSGAMQEDYWKNKPTLGNIKLEDFAKEFAGAYNAS